MDTNENRSLRSVAKQRMIGAIRRISEFGRLFQDDQPPGDRAIWQK
jgi:hypothetical protein